MLLETATWKEAEQWLSPERVVVIPLGSACKEHGPHLPLNNDWLIAEFLKKVVLDSMPEAVVLPTVNHHFYPAFQEYPGSISLRLDTARDLIVDICKSINRFGPKIFYALNTGVSTERALAPAAEQLERDGICLRFTRLKAFFESLSDMREQEGGSHADELETSLMLDIAPHAVHLEKAVKEYNEGTGRLTRIKGAEGVFSESGVWGDPTLASAKKGKAIREALVRHVLDDLAGLRNSATGGAG